ncbi:hypothetical protein, partial [Streptomyces sp. NPDC086023]|uniref:hypothetical protein n=1 Tax=Streptomyces sp. NPDC086023 TaxID=3365746 RepID=UPI0037CDDBD2
PAERVPQRCALCQRTVSLRSTGHGFAVPEPALRAGVLRFAPDWFGVPLRSTPNGLLRRPE